MIEDNSLFCNRKNEINDFLFKEKSVEIGGNCVIKLKNLTTIAINDI